VPWYGFWYSLEPLETGIAMAMQNGGRRAAREKVVKSTADCVQEWDTRVGSQQELDFNVDLEVFPEHLVPQLL